MLGCHDFCGHYEWTFHYIRRRWGDDALRRYWAEAIGAESQRHYTDGAVRAGLRGLYDAWTKTGVEEVCDWTFTLDEAKNVLRCDMRKCPSKGFLTDNDLNADEDYCDHCLGWMVPLLEKVGVEVIEQEHNHVGQCWCTMRAKDRPSEPLDLDIDIRKDPRWNHGYLHRWETDHAAPLLPSVSESPDAADALLAWFARYSAATVLGADAGQAEPRPSAEKDLIAVLATGRQYADRRLCPMSPAAVLIDDDEATLPHIVQRYLETPADQRPLLLRTYLPRERPIDFVTLGLPRPMPVLPLLIRSKLYEHRPGGLLPNPIALLRSLAKAIVKTGG